MSMNEWNKAKGDLRAAEQYMALIGKPQRTTFPGKGRLHSINVSTQVYHQETEGAKNYHNCKEFDSALAGVIRNNFPALRDEALRKLKDDVSRTGTAARESVESMLAEIDEYETQQ